VFFRLDPLQANESILTLPEELATNQLQPFVDWPCRQLFFDPTPEVCSDAEASAFATCAVAYPDLVAHACREHLADEKQQEAKRRLLQWSLPVALIAAIMILACAVIAAHR
jgi:predicted nucleic acid-binding Zn ribbon protein